MNNVEAEKTGVQAELLFNRVSKRYSHLKKWAKNTGTNAFRLYDRDIPEIPLVLDFYNGAVSGALYKSAYEKDEAWLPAMKASVAKALGIPEDRVFLKERQRQRRRQESGSQYGRISTQRFYTDAKEGGLSYRVNLSDYLDTGLFLDARKKRALIRTEANGKRVLNLFAYTCSLSIAAAAGAAMETVSVDLSNTYLEWGRINFALNRLEAQYIEEGFFFRSLTENRGNTLIRSDVLGFIAQAAKQKRHWDIIILDPPSFSNSKKMKGALDIRRDSTELIRSCLTLLSHNGTLFFSSNAKGFRLESGDYPGYTVKDITNELEDEDFRGKRMPVCYAIGK